MNGNMWHVSGFTHLRELGSGASGRVVLATHDATGTSVAIKYLSGEVGEPSFRATFRAEAELLAEIDDPHVSRLYEYVESAQGAAIVMELVNGVSLRQMLRANGPTEPESALYVLKGSLLGLQAAHQRGVVHRDYKPENVLITAEGESKLADFGIAVPVGQEAGPIISGTPRYMAPEHWTGAPATPASDIYAATATFYECLTGRPPYDGRELPVLRDQHAHAQIPAELAPEPVRDLLRQGLAKRPDERPQPAAAFLGLLESVAVAAYGPAWEERGRDKLAERAALLALLFPFRDAAGGGTGVANTALASGGGWTGRMGWGRKTLIAGGAMAMLLVGGIGLSYASRDDTRVESTGKDPSAITGPGPFDALSAPAVVSPTPPPSSSPSPATSVIVDPTRSLRPTPSRTPRRTPSATPSTSPSPTDTPPTVQKVGANPTMLVPAVCTYGTKSSTIWALVADDETPPDQLRVSFTYTLNGVTKTVGMSYGRLGDFRGVLGDLPMPKLATRIAIDVRAVDAAGNTSPRVPPVYVTLDNNCPIG